MIVWLMCLAGLGGFVYAARDSGDHPETATLMAFGFLLLAAFLTGKIASRLGLPKLTGYLLLGVLAGPHVLGLVGESTTHALKVVSESAVCIIALTAGSEINFAKIRPVMPTLRAITLFAVVGAMVVLAGTVYLLRPLLPFLDAMPADQAASVAAVIGVALSAQSPAVVMALMAETRAAGPLSSVILGSVVVADLVVITMYAIASTVASSMTGAGSDVLGTAVAVIWQLFGSIAFGAAMGAVLGQFLLRVQRGAALFAVLICVVVAEVGTRALLDPLIVMLAAGIWLENVSRADAHALLGEIESARLPLFLVFFAVAGSHIDIAQLAAAIVPVGIIAVARAVAFYAGSTVACRVSGAEPVVARYAWFGLVPQSGLALALALLVQQSFPSFGDAASVIVFGVVGLNEIVSPVILRAVILKSGEAYQKPETDFAAVDH